MTLSYSYNNVHLKILADAMGLGKTIMTLSLLLTHTERGLSSSRRSSEKDKIYGGVDTTTKDVPKLLGFDKAKKRKPLNGGGNLIICPMTLLSQWKVPLVINMNYLYFIIYEPLIINLVVLKDKSNFSNLILIVRD